MPDLIRDVAEWAMVALLATLTLVSAVGLVAGVLLMARASGRVLLSTWRAR